MTFATEVTLSAVMNEPEETAMSTAIASPGRPMAHGRIHAAGAGSRSAVLFGLPGNPVAVMVSFYAMVRDALLRMAGAAPEPLAMLSARSAEPIRKKPGRTEY